MQEVDPFQSRLDEKAWLPTFLLKNSSVTVQNSSPQSQQLNHSSSTVFDSSQSHALLNSDIHDWLISKALRLSTVSFLQCKELKAVVSEDLATNKTYYPSCSMTWHGSLNFIIFTGPYAPPKKHGEHSVLWPIGLLVSQSDKIALAMAKSAQSHF